MPILSDANQDAKSVGYNDVALGPRVGFMEGYKIAAEAQERASAQYGIENAMQLEDDAQYRAMKEAGIEDAPKLSPNSVGFFASYLPGPAADSDVYMDTARFFSDGGDPAQATRLGEYDNKIEGLRKKYPDLNLRTSREMFDTVKTKAVEAEHRLNTSRTTLGGAVGEFVGGAVASMNPNTDPFNFLTIGVGGVGKTAAVRIASQFGAQGFIETVNQVTGVQEQREMLGLSHGFQDAAMRIGATAIGGAVLQGTGEAIVAGGKRFFRNTPNDPAPKVLPEETPTPARVEPQDANALRAQEPQTYHTVLHEVSPFSTTRTGQARTVLDTDHVSARLEDWSGPAPHAVPPKTDTAIPSPVNDFVAPDIKVDDTLPPDDLARSIDPQAFRMYDDLATRKQNFRAWLDEMGAERNVTDVKVTELQDRLDKIEDIIENPRSPARARKKAEKDKLALMEQRDAEIAKVAQSDTPEMARVRSELMKVDTKMRDLAPVISRAYARSRDEWDLNATDRQRVRDMVREGARNLPEDVRNPIEDLEPEEVFENYTLGLEDRAPILKQRAKVEDKLGPDADAADVASAIVKENAKILDEGLEELRATIDGVLDGNKKKVQMPGVKRKLDLDNDKVVVPQTEGEGFREITVREFLEEQRETEFELEAIKTCSIK